MRILSKATSSATSSAAMADSQTNDMSSSCSSVNSAPQPDEKLPAAPQPDENTSSLALRLDAAAANRIVKNSLSRDQILPVLPPPPAASASFNEMSRAPFRYAVYDCGLVQEVQLTIVHSLTEASVGITRFMSGMYACHACTHTSHVTHFCLITRRTFFSQTSLDSTPN